MDNINPESASGVRLKTSETETLNTPLGVDGATSDAATLAEEPKPADPVIENSGDVEKPVVQPAADESPGPPAPSAGNDSETETEPAASVNSDDLKQMKAVLVATICGTGGSRAGADSQIRNMTESEIVELHELVDPNTCLINDGKTWIKRINEIGRRVAEENKASTEASESTENEV